MRAFSHIAVIVPLFSLILPQGYGYSRQEDPLLKAFKHAVRSARDKEWADAERATKGVAWQLEELRDDFGIDLSDAVAEATAKHDLQATANAWANLVALALLQKLHWNLREKVARFVPARARARSATVYYEDVLAGNVRARDERDGTDHHGAMLALLKEVRESVGSEGLFGVGAREPEPERFARAADGILALVRKVFPFFVTPKRLGAATPVGEHEGDGDE